MHEVLTKAEALVQTQDDIDSGKFALYLTPVEYVSDKALARVTPNPARVHEIGKFLSQDFNWAQQLHRLMMPAPEQGVTGDMHGMEGDGVEHQSEPERLAGLRWELWCKTGREPDTDSGIFLSLCTCCFLTLLFSEPCIISALCRHRFTSASTH